MQIGFRFDHGIVTVRFLGEYPFEDAKAALLAALPDVKSAHVRGTLVDVSESWSFLTRSQLELESIGAFDDHIWRQPRRGRGVRRVGG